MRPLQIPAAAAVDSVAHTAAAVTFAAEVVTPAALATQRSSLVLFTDPHRSFAAYKVSGPPARSRHPRLAVVAVPSANLASSAGASFTSSVRAPPMSVARVEPVRILVWPATVPWLRADLASSRCSFDETVGTGPMTRVRRRAIARAYACHPFWTACVLPQCTRTR